MSLIWLVILIWFVVIFISTIFISQYIKMQKREDVAIAFYILYLTMSQILAAKVGDFSIGNFKITAPVAVIIFPFTFQITDMVNENFGRKKTHRMIFIAFITQIFMTIFIWFSFEIPGAADVWGPDAQSYWIDFLGSTIRIIAASWIAFLITENLDAVLFASIKKLTKDKNLWIRNIFSDIPTLALDSLIFITIAFIGDFPLVVIGELIVGQILTKWFFGVADTPFMYLSRGIINERINIFGKLFLKKKDL